MWSVWTQSRKSDAASVNIPSELRCLDFSVGVNILLGTEEAIALLQKKSSPRKPTIRQGFGKPTLLAFSQDRKPSAEVVLDRGPVDEWQAIASAICSVPRGTRQM